MKIRYRLRTAAARHENLFTFLWYLRLVKNEEPSVPENECYLDDDGLSPEVQAVEAGEDPQALCVRVGPVFYPDGKAKEPGIWIEYQEHHMRGPLTGPVLLTPGVWRDLNRSVERRLRTKIPLWRRMAWNLGWWLPFIPGNFRKKLFKMIGY